jgi:hypothetical protein
MNLFNKVIGEKPFPKGWKMAMICPIYKKEGNVSEPNNYRIVSLLTVLRKIFKSTLADRQCGWLINTKILSSFQAGFIKI